MKITVCGKGGCGKSTVTTLLAKELARMGKKVLVVDSDESNFGLHRQLGVELPRDFTEYFGGKDKAFKTMMTSGADGANGGADGGKNDAHKDASSDPSAGLDALDKLKSQISCPVDLKSLAGSM